MKKVTFNEANTISIDDIDYRISNSYIVVACCITKSTPNKCDAIHTLHKLTLGERYGWQRIGLSERYTDADGRSCKEAMQKLKRITPSTEFYIFDNIYEFADWLKTV